jgi:hypothetical protein
MAEAEFLVVDDAVDPLAVLGDVPLPYQFTLLSAAATTNTRLYSS